jgi:hypothetical protein
MTNSSSSTTWASSGIGRRANTCDPRARGREVKPHRWKDEYNPTDSDPSLPRASGLRCWLPPR